MNQPTRAQRRSMGMRKLKRECHRDVVRIIELGDRGFRPSSIAPVVGLPAPFVADVLRRAEEVRRGEGDT